MTNPDPAGQQEEIFEIVDENDSVIGTASRRECHGNPALIHRTAHVIVYHPDGRILLQKRSRNKDIQPGKWDTAVGGHLDPGETYEQAARREMHEELGVPDSLELTHIFDSRIRNQVESENVRVYSTVYDGPFSIDPVEIDEIRFWEICELRSQTAKAPDQFTPNLLTELKQLL